VNLWLVVLVQALKVVSEPLADFAFRHFILNTLEISTHMSK
jgi:hypothetical protein